MSHRNGLLRRIGYGGLAVFVGLVFVWAAAGTALASPQTCPSTLSQADCDAIYGPWVGWDTAGSACSSSTVNLTGNDNAQKAFNYYVAKGLNAVQAAGIVGNFFEESGGVNPNVNQNGGGPGRGIAQWSVNERWQGVIKLADQQGKQPTDLSVQLDFSWQELTGSYSFVLQHVKAATTVDDATKQFMGPIVLPSGGAGGGYEDPGVPHFDIRLKDAQMILSQYGGSVQSSAGTDAAATSPSGCAQAVNCTTGGTAATGSLSTVRQNVVCIARQELATWKAGVQKNEYCKKYINGLNQPGGVGGGWCEEWCADFTSWVYDQAKDPLKADPNWRLPAVVQIQAVGQEEKSFHWHDVSSGYVPRPGDIVIHLNGESHVNIVESVAGNTITMIGGDQGGPNYGGPDSTSVVSEYQSSITSDGISGFVSPD